MKKTALRNKSETSLFSVEEYPEVFGAHTFIHQKNTVDFIFSLNFSDLPQWTGELKH